ncbi:dihydroorotate dehydrogenase electron transfer subunit, partial [Candidatus Micrarchaeota archaeon]|nr:dihydroorotate dehydrogenase electron transfer subunit [Candidatus Micrarchaeota archaeon]
MLPKAFKVDKIVMENTQTKTFLLDGKYNAKPGQFVMAWLPDVNEKPMSIGSASPISLSIANVGGFSSSMHALKEGDKIWLRGPFGNFYNLKGKSIALVAGGYGVAPLRFLAKEAIQKGLKVKMIMGARSKDLMMLPPQCETI